MCACSCGAIWAAEFDQEDHLGQFLVVLDLGTQRGLRPVLDQGLQLGLGVSTVHGHPNDNAYPPIGSEVPERDFEIAVLNFPMDHLNGGWDDHGGDDQDFPLGVVDADTEDGGNGTMTDPWGGEGSWATCQGQVFLNHTWPEKAEPASAYVHPSRSLGEKIFTEIMTNYSVKAPPSSGSSSSGKVTVGDWSAPIASTTACTPTQLALRWSFGLH